MGREGGKEHNGQAGADQGLGDLHQAPAIGEGRDPSGLQAADQAIAPGDLEIGQRHDQSPRDQQHAHGSQPRMPEIHRPGPRPAPQPGEQRHGVEEGAQDHPPCEPRDAQGTGQEKRSKDRAAICQHRAQGWPDKAPGRVQHRREHPAEPEQNRPCPEHSKQADRPILHGWRKPRPKDHPHPERSAPGDQQPGQGQRAHRQKRHCGGEAGTLLRVARRPHGQHRHEDHGQGPAGEQEQEVRHDHRHIEGAFIRPGAEAGGDHRLRQEAGELPQQAQARHHGRWLHDPAEKSVELFRHRAHLQGIPQQVFP